MTHLDWFESSVLDIGSHATSVFAIDSSVDLISLSKALRRRGLCWLDWLRVELEWLVAPWRAKRKLLKKIELLQVAIDHDAVTGAYSRVFFSIALQQEAARLARDEHHHIGQSFVVGMLDIDFFKQLNDRQGHQAGDLALIRVVEEARPLFGRKLDVFARYGGDEFAFLLPQTSMKSAAMLADSLRVALYRQAGISVSIGLVNSAPGCTAESLLKAADATLYRAKRTRNTVCIASKSDHV